MAYQALLFCPEEKTARTVTQVLSELEFSVEPCSEPFAAVKKLMGQHFDAIVVDCDNEQNATLLFKSARNSTSNQASLAVAIVEGQAGVAKAFRIGANLVLTKPINVEQSKGTLRVARGLLRKGEPIKPPLPATPAAPAVSAAAAPNPAAPKPAAPKPVVPAKPETPVIPAASVAPRPAVAAPAKPPTSLPAARAAVARAAQAPPAKAPEKIEAPGIPAAPVAPAAATMATPSATSVAPVTGRAVESQAPQPKPMFSMESAGGGSAAAAAPARKMEPVVPAEPAAKVEITPAKTPHKAEALFDKAAEETPATPVAALQGSSVASSGDAPSTEATPSFTFGGANLEEEAGSGGKKIGIGIAAVVVVAAGLYFVWGHFAGHSNASPAVATTTMSSAPMASSAPAVPPKPSAAPVTIPSETKPVAENPSPISSSGKTVEHAEDSSDREASATPATSGSGKAVPTKPEAAPLVVKSGAAPVHKTAAVPDASAPSLAGIATAGSNGALSNILSSGSDETHPILQTLHVSQGVSQGLLMKKVQPVYPKAALTMHVEGNVDLLATISKEGMITSVKVLKGDTQLSKAAADAVKQWKYKPYLLDGEPVEIQTQITVVFKLPN
jgi:TonB family protein